ncbi:MAG: J domain-containing protein [Ancalomicrobiaceae bacterium]|nr:J domain-containing protein [Ancalomicrobiaceae bacterium]
MRLVDAPYKTLGVARDASQDVIHRAYLRLAKQHHPDLNPGNSAAEARFKAISAANSLLSDVETRGKFDRGEIDASGQERRPQPNYRDFADADTGRRYSRSGANPRDWSDDSFDDIFGSMFHESDGARRMGGQDHLFSITIDFLEAVNGATKRLGLPDGADFDVKIPAGTDDGQVLRLRGKGGAPGDALIEVHVAPHAVFHRDGQDIRLDLPVSFAEAVLGGSVEVPTPAGPVRMKVPPHSDTATKLRLRGRGVPAHGGRSAGDLIATLRLVFGPTDAALEAFLRDWAPDHPNNPRQTMEATL